MRKHTFCIFQLKVITKWTCRYHLVIGKLLFIKDYNLWRLTIDTNVNWKHQINEVITKLNKARYAITSIKPFLSLDVLWSAEVSFAHSIILYGVVFWGKSSHSEEIIKVQKRIINIIMNLSKIASCQQPLKDLNILEVLSQYIISIPLLLTKLKNNL